MVMSGYMRSLPSDNSMSRGGFGGDTCYNGFFMASSTQPFDLKRLNLLSFERFLLVVVPGS